MVKTGEAVWTTPDYSGEVPSARSGHTVTIMGRRAYVFGGCGESNGAATGFNDLYVLELSDLSWKKIEAGGSIPAPRWKHTTNNIPGNKLLVFGGVGKRARYNDCFTLDVAAEEPTWIEWKVDGAPPPPRGNHTTTLVKDMMIIFGGYGGVGQARSFMNDLYTVELSAASLTKATNPTDIENPEWVKQNMKGNVPKPRGSHTSSVVEGSYLFVIGGRDHMTYFDDCNILEIGSGHLSAAIESVPSFKLFVFGGQTGNEKNRTEWKYLNNVTVLDTGSMIWTSPPVSGKCPSAREDSSWAYDPKSCKLVMVGGWSGQWLNDVHLLDVAGIVGPPYAVVELEPNMGPITGNSPLTIRGLNFIETKEVLVKFTDGRVEENVPGQWVSPTEITCASPVWEKYGAGEVDVRVSLRGEGFTVNRVRWSYYVNTRPQKCLAYGPGLFEDCVWGLPAQFIVQAKDSTGRNRMSGGDQFVTRVTFNGAEVPAMTKDNNDGTYEVTYIPRTVGEYTVEITFEDPVQGNQKIPIRGSPWTVRCEDPWLKPKVSGHAPKARQGVAASALVRRLVLTGGDDLGVVNVLDTDSWKWDTPSVSGTAPSPRLSFSFTAIDNEKVVVFGGRQVSDDVKAPVTLLNDVHFLACEKDSWRWSKPLDIAGTHPAARCGHSGAIVPVGKRLILFGGKDATGALLNEAVVLGVANVLKMEWLAVSHAEGSVAPPGREGHDCAVYDGKFYVFGGKSDEVLDTVHVATIDKSNVVGWDLVKVAGTAPTARTGHVFSTVENKLYMYGGYDSHQKFLDELYMLDTDSWTWKAIYASDGSWASSNLVYSVVQKKLVALSASRTSWDEIRVLEFGKIENLVQRIGVRIQKELRDFEKFNAETMADLQLKPADENTDAKQFATLLKVMKSIYDTKNKAPLVELQLDVLKEGVSFLEKNGVNVEKSEKDLKEVIDGWANVKKAAPDAKENIRPVQDREAHKTKQSVQTFTDRMKEFRREFDKKDYYAFKTGVAEAYKSMTETRKRILDLQEEASQLTNMARLFDFPDLMKAPEEVLKTCFNDLVSIKSMWDMIAMINFQFEEWNDTLWSSVNTEVMEDGTKTFFKQLRTVDKALKSQDPFMQIEGMVKNFMASIPLVTDLRHPSMRQRHWQMLMDTTKVQFEITDTFKLRNLLDLQLHKFEEDIGEIVNRAQKEEKMEAMLKKINETWKDLLFEFNQHKDTPIQLVKLSEEDFETLEDHQVQVQNMMASKYLATFEKEITTWQKQLATVADVVQIIGEIQRTWAYLETLFIGSEEVKKELPEDTKRFAGIHGAVQRILAEFFETKNVCKACNKAGLYEELEKLQQQLELCEKSLADYLEQKRRTFPRFFFVSTSDLLDILSNGNNPFKINTHMPKIVAAIDSLDLRDNGAGQRPTAMGMTSCVGQEAITLHKPLKLEGRVEFYLQDIITTIADCLCHILKDSISSYASKERSQWILDFPNQVVLVTSIIFFTNEVEDSFRALKGGDRESMKRYNERQIVQLTKLIELTRTNIDRGARQKVMCLITLDAHSRDVIEKIMVEKVEDPKAFQWQSQLRYRWDSKADDCFINISDACFHYGFEYQGNGPRLVITPLTDRLYVTATQSLHLAMGCAPAGPAGTGKTETTKDLAANMGKAVYVFNCSPEMDYRSMGDIFKGLAASGSWGCFDEFNRLVAEVLSVCSTQFKAVVDAIKEKRQTFVLMGAEMKLNPTCGAFITMNPGYLGRTELPESLKVLFRPVTVMVPDLELICENMLMAEGFATAKLLARKFVQLYALLRDLLSKQAHYDWGMRAIKSVLVVAGSFKRAEPDVSESALLFRALRDFNLPKIVGDDLIVFNGLLGDLFPGVDIPRKRDMDLERCIEEVTKESLLQTEPDFILKVVQLQELMQIRHCVFILGTSGTGKSEAWKMLAKANGKIGMKTTVRDLNPKSITTNEFYGYIQLATREWKDGIFSCLMRDLANMPDSNPKWIILDGDLDANWIESMNSVMDDNKLLTLASNERIQLKPSMRLIFELRDLRYASPATVSRAGILYITEGKQWNSFVQSWIDRRDETVERKKILQQLFELYVPETIKTIRKDFKHLVPTLEFNMIQSLCYILDGLLTPENIPKGVAEEKKLIETYFVFAAVWAFGSGLSIKDGVDYRKNFSSWWKQKWNNVKFPMKGSVHDFFVEKGTAKFAPWTQIVPTISYSSTQPMTTVTVPTAETCSVGFLMDMLIANRKAALLVGLAGCGKTALVRGKLQSLSDEFMSMTVNFNYYTDSIILQRIMEGPLEKKAGRNFGPPGSKRLVYFVDDLNMPQLDPYDTQTPIALLRQHFDYIHWYDRAKLTLKVINNVQYVACMNPSAGSFIIDPRLQRHFVTFAIGFPGSEALMTIFSTFLNGHLKDFAPTVADPTYANKVIQAGLELHGRVAQTFRKTAVNFHYEFSIRHLANVFQGMLMSKADHFSDCAKFASLWVHESERVYGDRLVSMKDFQAYQKLVREIGKKYFKDYDQNVVFAEPLIICNCWKDLDDKSYNKVESIDKLKQVLEDALTSYNETNATMNLVLFNDAMKHVCRVSRIVQNNNALLVGVGGSGKQSLTRLAAFICGYTVVQIAISGNYSISDLKEDLKNMYNKSGLKSDPLLFLFTDSQIADERFLVYINELLASGDVPDLFANDEKDGVMNSVRNEAKSMGIPDTREALWEFFISKVRANLHVALCFSPVGEAFRRRASRFPALVNCTVIDWFQPWPEDALHSVAKRFLDDVDLGTTETRDAIVKFMPFSFQCVNAASTDYLAQERRFNYTTPKSFLELIYLYKNMLSRKRDDSQKAIDRLQNGLQKLEKTARDVSILQDELSVKQVEVEEKKRVADELMVKVGAEKTNVEAEAAKAQVEAEKTAVLAEACQKQSVDCEADLAKAEPMVAAAEEALDTLNKKDLGELKALAKPPAGVDDVTAAILALRGEKDRSWNAAKSMMKEIGKFIEELKGMKQVIDTGNMTKSNVDASRPYLALEFFNVPAMSKKSKAAAGLCDFVLNIVAYYDIVVTVEPKRNALRQAQNELEAANTKLAEVRAHVANLQEQLAKLEAEFSEVVAEKNRVLAEAEKLQQKLDLAMRLMNALGSENERWRLGVEKLKTDSNMLVGDVLLASGFVSYIGCFNKVFRDQLVSKKWMPFFVQNKVPMSEGADPLTILTNDAMIAGWNNEGLPFDRVSIENGAIVTTAERWPLLIDPQLQGIAWIKEREAKNNLQIVRMGQKGMLTTMERALENGYSVLLENIQESIDAVLAPIIARQKIKKGRNFFIKVGDKEVEYHPKFKLFLQTKLSNPHYPPEIQAECTLINFTVTEDGLEDQLLAHVVRKERPELEEQKSSLIKQQNEFRIKLKELEDSLLKQLSEAEGDILENRALIESLEEAKRLATEIQEKVLIAKETEVKINEARELYRKVASRGSLLFFLLSEMFKIHQLYHFSLSAFLTVFLRAIDTAGKKFFGPPIIHSQGYKLAQTNAFQRFKQTCLFLRGGIKGLVQGGRVVDKSGGALNLDVRLAQLMENITFQVFNYTRRGLFEKHKLLFATQLTLKILMKDSKLDLKETEYLIQGRRSLNAPALSFEMAQWLTEATWSASQSLQELPAFAKFCADLEANAKLWRQWCSEEQPEKSELPGEWKKLNEFQRLLVLRALRSDRLSSALTTYIVRVMGARYIEQDPFSIVDTYKEASPASPLFFYLFPGADIVKDIDPILKKKGYSLENGKFINISMGQGQEAPAEEALDRFMKEGGWVFLQNIHLMSRWVKVLERKLEVAAENAHVDFRCFLSAEPHPDPQAKVIPESIMQNSIKIANEPPQNLKANLRRAWANFSQDFLDKSTKKKEFRTILFSLCFFHSLVLGRRRFGFQGWSRNYSFNVGDLSICADVLHNQLQINDDVPWEDIRYIFGEIMYGGHITDKWDRRTNNTYLEVLIRKELFDGMNLAPGFKAMVDGTYDDFRNYIETGVPAESPILFGLHPNAEIGFLTAEADILFKTILELQGAVSASGGGSKDDVVKATMQDFLDQLPQDFNIRDINGRITDKTPYLVVALQEMDRMNTLLSEIRRTLNELKLGLEGALNISDAMEALSSALFLDRIPGNWEKVAYPSSKPLASWYLNLLERVDQLAKWAETLQTPRSVWLSGLFNPMAFLTAVMQVTARSKNWPLDQVTIQTDVTAKTYEQVDQQPDEGAFVHGLFLEGARWDVPSGMLKDSFLKDLHPVMPVLHVKAIPVEEQRTKGYYECPVYYTAMRGATFIFPGQLKTDELVSKWILAGVALLLNVE